MHDFSIPIYEELLRQLKAADYHFLTFEEFLTLPERKSVVLRHDVDVRRFNSLRFARIQHSKGIKATYYFRMVPVSYDESIIREIHELGHEIGYHYEDMDFAKGDPHKAIKLFEKHLAQLRTLAPVNTICMHGSPRSKWDNREVWNHYNYRDYGIIGEPYMDIDFSKVFYLTDTGRRWDGHKVSVRDKVSADFDLSFHSTNQIIESIRTNNFPHQVMFNFHPQRWMDYSFKWIREKYVQTLKNAIKYCVVRWGPNQKTPI